MYRTCCRGGAFPVTVGGAPTCKKKKKKVELKRLAGNVGVRCKRPVARVDQLQRRGVACALPIARKPSAAAGRAGRGAAGSEAHAGIWNLPRRHGMASWQPACRPRDRSRAALPLRCVLHASAWVRPAPPRPAPPRACVLFDRTQPRERGLVAARQAAPGGRARRPSRRSAARRRGRTGASFFVLTH